MAKISRPPVALPQPPAKYDQREEMEFRRLVAQYLAEPIEDIIRPSDLTVTLAISACEATDAGSAGPPYNQLDVPFTYTGMPTGTVFDVSYNNGVAGGVDSDTGIAMTTSPQTKTFTSVTFSASPLTDGGSVTVIAKYNGQTIATAVRNKAYVA